MYQLFPIDTFMVIYYIYGRHNRAVCIGMIFDRFYDDSS